MTPARTLPLLFTLLVACGGATGSTGSRASGPIEPTVRDSAGVTIHDLPADALARAAEITIDTQAVTVIGGTDTEHDVTRLAELVVLADGRVAGFDGQRGAVRVFDASGEEVASHGRRGEGPGEFGGFTRLSGMSGDSLLATDLSNNRVSIIAPSGGVVMSQGARLREGGESFIAVGRLDDGGVVLAPSNMIVGRSASSEPLPRRAPVPVGVVRPDQALDAFDTLLTVPGTEMARFMSQFGPKPEMIDGVPAFGARSLVVGWQGMAAVATNEHWDVQLFDQQGRLRRRIAMPGPLQAVTDLVRASWKERSLAYSRARSAEMGERAAESMAQAEYMVEHMAMADSIPPFSSIQQGSGQVIWLLETPRAYGDSLRYLALDAKGRLLGRLGIDGSRPTLRPYAFGDDRVVLRTEDADGFVRYEVHKLRMPQ